MRVNTVTFFQKLLTKGQWPLVDPILLRSHVCTNPMIIVSKSLEKTSMYADTVINFAKVTTYYTCGQNDNIIVSFWTKFSQDKNYDSYTFFKLFQIG